MATKVEALYQAAINAVPATGAITYEALRQSLIDQGLQDALPYISEAKRRGELRARLEYVDGQVIHTYERGS